jgi:hypothetical protein
MGLLFSILTVAAIVLAAMILIGLLRWLLRINDAVAHLDKIESHLREIAKNTKKPEKF